MPATTQEQLDAVNDAIEKVAAGVREYTAPDGSRVVYPSLKELMDTRERLEGLLAREQSGATYMRAQFGRSS